MLAEKAKIPIVLKLYLFICVHQCPSVVLMKNLGGLENSKDGFLQIA